MAEQVHPEDNDAELYSLYVRRRARLSLELFRGALADALMSMFNESARQRKGHLALVLYSDPQYDIYRPGSLDEKRALRRDNDISRRLQPLKSKQHKPARWIEARRPNTQETHFRMSFLLEPAIQEALHAGVYEGVNQAMFGRKAIEATLAIPDVDIVETEALRRAASREIRAALWANDAATKESSPIAIADGQRNYATNIGWVSRTEGDALR